MAEESVLQRGKSWSTGSDSGSVSAAATRWRKNERYLKQLEQDARKSSDDLKNLKEEVDDLSTTYENLKKLDAQRVERLGELVGLLETKDNAAMKEEVFQPSSESGDTLEGDGLNRQKQQQEEEDVDEAQAVEGNVDEQLESLKSEHEAAQSEILHAQASLERKQVELEMLSGEHKNLSDLIAKEEKLVEPAESDESLQETVQHEMRTLSEDLGRLGRLVEGLKDSSADQLKTREKPRTFHQVVNRGRSKSLSGNFQNGSASDPGHSVGLRSASSGIRSKEPSQFKEPAEFEAREGCGTRKRHKNSSFEQQRERLQEQRAKLEEEAKEKNESKAGRPVQPIKGAASSRGSTPSYRQILSPSSVFEELEEAPSIGSLGPVRTGSTGSNSVSSELSAEFSIGKVDPSLLSASAKRLDFSECDAKDGPGVGSVPSPEDTASSFTSQENFTFTVNGLDDGEEIVGGNSQAVPQVEEIESEGSSSGKVEEADLFLGNGSEEIDMPASISTGITIEEILSPEVLLPETEAEKMQGPEVLSPESGTEGTQRPEVFNPESGPKEGERPVPEAENFQPVISGPSVEEVVNNLKGPDDDIVRTSNIYEILTQPEAAEEAAEEEVEEIEEFDSFGDAEEEDSRVEEVRTSGNGVEEIDVAEEDIEDFEDAETADGNSERQILKAEIGTDEVGKPTETTQDSSGEENNNETTEAAPPLAALFSQLQQNGSKFADVGDSGVQIAPEAEQLQTVEMGTPVPGDLTEPRNWRIEAENQMVQLSSQLSLLQKQVEEEVELHEKSKNDLELEQTSEEKEQLSKQVSFFADEVRGLRQNIDEIQRIVYREGGDSSVVEHWAKDLHSKCADQSAQLEHLGKQVSTLGKDLKQHLKLRVDIDGKLDKQAQERQKVEAQLTDLSKALALTVSTIEKEEEAVGELAEQQKHLLVDQLKEAEKLRHIAEVRVATLNKQIDQLEMVCDVAQNYQAVSKYQDKAMKYGFQTLVQMLMLAVGVITLYSTVVEPSRGSLVPT